ncbi:zinc finger protein 567-like [Daktulosphaira vitifoliae]|uniref:zinc finger protein 567-like n=1 Tax=Daktulosphaira vitifoliae TaxID=58002 RepID=UPI0021A978B8|nr:zinc finger protein 567-like [Daktulosphaira vitifoliae]
MILSSHWTSAVFAIALPTVNSERSINDAIFTSERFVCPNKCGRSFSKKVNLKYHFKNECGIKFVCGICNRQFSQKTHLKRHICVVHKCVFDGEERHICPNNCGKSYKYKGGLHTHLKEECGILVPKYKCEICLKRFKHKGNMNTHFKVCANLPPDYRCFKCNKSFYQKSNLRSHLVVIHRIVTFIFISLLGAIVDGILRGEGQFQCPKCEKCYVHLRNLHRHLKNECGIEPSYQCPWCPKKCRYKFTLRSHIFVLVTYNYNRGKPRKNLSCGYICPQCGRSYVHKYSMQTHMKYEYMLTARYLCPNMCGRSYKYKRGVHTHVNFECGVEPRFKCSLCPKKFARKFQLESHLVLKHKVWFHNKDFIVLTTFAVVITKIKDH